MGRLGAYASAPAWAREKCGLAGASGLPRQTDVPRGARVIMGNGEALARHISAEAAGFVDHVFSLHDTAQIQGLVSGAGFHNVSVQADTKQLGLPAPEEFLWQYVHSTPLAGAVAQVDDDRRRLLERDVVAEWQEFAKDGALMLQVRVVVATARK